MTVSNDCSQPTRGSWWKEPILYVFVSVREGVYAWHMCELLYASVCMCVCAVTIAQFTHDYKLSLPSQSLWLLTFIHIDEDKLSCCNPKFLEIFNSFIPWKVRRRILTDQNRDKVVKTAPLSGIGPISTWKQYVVVIQMTSIQVSVFTDQSIWKLKLSYCQNTSTFCSVFPQQFK